MEDGSVRKKRGGREEARERTNSFSRRRLCPVQARCAARGLAGVNHHYITPGHILQHGVFTLPTVPSRA